MRTVIPSPNRFIGKLILLVLCVQMALPGVFFSPVYAHPLPTCDTGNDVPVRVAPAPPGGSASPGPNLGNQPDLRFWNQGSINPSFGQEFSGDDDIGGQGLGEEGRGLGAPGPAGIGVGGGTGDSSASGGWGFKLQLLRVAVLGSLLVISGQVGCSGCGCCDAPGSCDDGNTDPNPPRPASPPVPAPPASPDPIDLLTGSVTEAAADLRITSPAGTLTIGRSYSSHPETSCGTQGFGWSNTLLDLRLELTNCSSLPPQKITLFIVSGSSIEFEYANITEHRYDSLIPTDYSLHAVEVPESSPTIYHYHLINKQTGEMWIFDETGKLIEVTTVWWYGDGGTNGGFTLTGTNTFLGPDGQEYPIVLAYDSAQRIKSIKVYSDTSMSLLQQEVVYTYWNDQSPDDHAESLGQACDLVQVKVSRVSSSGVHVSRYTQYRYDDGHRLVAIFNHDGIMSCLEDFGLTDPSSLLELESDNDTGTSGREVTDFADRTYEYFTGPETTTSWANLYMEDASTNFVEVDETGRVMTGVDRPNGCASCGSGGSGITYEYHYLSRNTYSANPDPDDVIWLTIEDVKDANNTLVRRTIWGMNASGYAIREVIIEDPDGTSPRYWCSSKLFDGSGGRFRFARQPSAHTVVNNATKLKQFLDPSHATNDATTLNDYTGLIREFVYTIDGKLSQTTLQQGKMGDSYFETYLEYNSTVSTVHPYRIYTYHQTHEYDSADPDPFDEGNTSNPKPYTFTEYAYTFWGNNHQRVKQRTIKLPSVSTEQNGSGLSTEQYEYYDEAGRLRWTKNGDGYVTYRHYDAVHGLLAYQIRDVDTSQTNWTGWAGPEPANFERASGLPDALNYETSNTYDALGRIVQREYPAGHSTFLRYEKTKTITFPHVNASGQPGRPVIVTKWDTHNRNSEIYTVDPGGNRVTVVSNKPTSIDDSDPEYFVSLTVKNYDPVSGATSAIHRYHNIPDTTLYGSEGLNYYSTRFLYTPLGRRGGTIEYVDGSRWQVKITIFDPVHNRPIESRMGVSNSINLTYDSLASSTPSSMLGYATTGETVYDEGGVGDGFITGRKNYWGTGSTDYIETRMYYTYRGHLRGIKRSTSTQNITPYQVFDVNWKGFRTGSATYVSEPSWSSILPTGSGANQYADYIAGSTSPFGRELTYYDSLDRVYRTDNYPGTVTASFRRYNNYYDRRDNLVASGESYSTYLETAYDGVGRMYQARSVSDVSQSTPYVSGAFEYNEPKPDGDFSSSSAWNSTLAGAGDEEVIQITHTTFNSSGDSIERHEFELTHDDSDGIDLGDSGSFIRSSVYSWYDPDTDLLVTVGNYGTGGGTSGSGSWVNNSIPSRPPFSSRPLVSADNVLVTLYGYESSSQRLNLISNRQNSSATADISTKTFFDDLGRRTAIAENHDDYEGADADIGGTAFSDRVTAWKYNGQGQTILLTAYNGSATNKQDTQYFYEDDHNARLVTNTIYPDSSDNTSSGTDQVTRTYNLDGSLATMTDQRQILHTYSYNDRRQLKLDSVSTSSWGSVDSSIQSIGREYDNFGRLEKVTSYASSAGTGTARNGILYYYWPGVGKHARTYQNHSDVATTSDLNVLYNYDTDADSGIYRNSLRNYRVEYPNGNRVAFERGSSTVTLHTDNIDDRLSRITGIDWLPSGGSYVDKVDYEHNGVSRLVTVDYIAPQIRRVMHHSSSLNDYDSWNRFGRQVNSAWIDYSGGGTAPVDTIRYGYDYAGNRIWRENALAAASSQHIDTYYTYDGLQRLVSSAQGDLAGTYPNFTGISGTPASGRSWGLDYLGNWSNYGIDTNGSVTLDQQRSHNEANENTSISAVTGPDWVDPVSDLAGNMTTIPDPDSPTSGFSLKYDAWNRLVEIKDGSNNPIQTNEYDGLNRRIVKTDNNGTTATGDDVSYDYFYNEQWQVVEIRKGGSSNPWKQYVYHPGYVDAIAFRLFDENTDGDIDDTPQGEGEHYYIQDANFNVTAVTDNTGAVVERYDYSPYGEVSFLSNAFTSQSSSISNEYLYTGRRRDPETGLQLNRNRFYASNIGRWVSRDPIGYDGGLNLYEYASSLPAVGLDPSGLSSEIGPPPGVYPPPTGGGGSIGPPGPPNFLDPPGPLDDLFSPPKKPCRPCSEPKFPSPGGLASCDMVSYKLCRLINPPPRPGRLPISRNPIPSLGGIGPKWVCDVPPGGLPGLNNATVPILGTRCECTFRCLQECVSSGECGKPPGDYFVSGPLCGRTIGKLVNDPIGGDICRCPQPAKKCPNLCK